MALSPNGDNKDRLQFSDRTNFGSRQGHTRFAITWSDLDRFEHARY